MDDLKTLFKKVDDSREEMLKTWQFLVNRDAGSANKEGVDQVAEDIADFLEPLGFLVHYHCYEEAGNMLVAEYGDGDKPFVVLTGHMDTVFKNGTAAERPFRIEDGKAYGPGVLDMKGGVTILLHAVKILVESGYDKYRLKVVLVGDEEVGHVHSDCIKDYLEEVKGALMGFNLETGFMDNGVVVERKGCAHYKISVHGIGAHAGNAPENGRSAIKELCHKVLDVEALTDYRKGPTYNVGVIRGGTVPNAIPEYAECLIDVRYRNLQEVSKVETNLKAIADKTYVEGTTTHFERTDIVAAMEKLPSTMELLERAEKAVNEAGLPPIHGRSTGGGSDSAYLTMAGVPTLCALGVRGEFNHTVREYAVVESLFEKAKMLLTFLTQL